MTNKINYKLNNERNKKNRKNKSLKTIKSDKYKIKSVNNDILLIRKKRLNNYLFNRFENISHFSLPITN